MTRKDSFMVVAAILTQASVGAAEGDDDKLAVSPELGDQEVREKNLMVWETFKVFYHGLVKNADDAVTFPEPKPEGNSSPIGQIAGVVGQILTPDLVKVIASIPSLIQSFKDGAKAPQSLP